MEGDDGTAKPRAKRAQQTADVGGSSATGAAADETAAPTRRSKRADMSATKTSTADAQIVQDALFAEELQKELQKEMDQPSSRKRAPGGRRPAANDEETEDDEGATQPKKGTQAKKGGRR